MLSVFWSSPSPILADTQQAVAVITAFSGTRFLYYMCHRSQCHSNLVTIPSSCKLLTLQAVLNQNLICQPSPSCCKIHMILDTLKNELKPPFTANITKGFLLHSDMNGEHFCEENLHNGNRNGEHFSGEIFHGNNTKRHIKSYMTHGNFFTTYVPLMTTTHGHPSCIQQLCKDNTQPWTQCLRS